MFIDTLKITSRRPLRSERSTERSEREKDFPYKIIGKFASSLAGDASSRAPRLFNPFSRGVAAKASLDASCGASELEGVENPLTRTHFRETFRSPEAREPLYRSLHRVRGFLRSSAGFHRFSHLHRRFQLFVCSFPPSSFFPRAAPFSLSDPARRSSPPSSSSFIFSSSFRLSRQIPSSALLRAARGAEASPAETR